MDLYKEGNFSMILETFVCGPLQNNTYAIVCPETKKMAIVDPAIDSAKVLITYVGKNQYQVEKILITHSHYDHIACVAELKEKYQAAVYVHEKDVENLEKPGSDQLGYGKNLKGCQPDHLLKGGEEILLGTIIIKVISTPGHSPGGVCYYIEKEKILFSGDTLFQGTMGNISFPHSNQEAMFESLQRLAKLPKETKVYPGHGRMTTIEKEKWIAHAKDYFF